MRSVTEKARGGSGWSPERDHRTLVIGLWVAIGVFVSWRGLGHVPALFLGDSAASHALAGVDTTDAIRVLLSVVGGLVAVWGATATYRAARGGREAILLAVAFLIVAYVVGPVGDLLAASRASGAFRSRLLFDVVASGLLYLAFVTFLARTYASVRPRHTNVRSLAEADADA